MIWILIISCYDIYNWLHTVKVISYYDWLIKQVHHDDEEPYYTVRVHATGRERQTDASHLVRPPSSPQHTVDDDSAIDRKRNTVEYRFWEWTEWVSNRRSINVIFSFCFHSFNAWFLSAAGKLAWIKKAKSRRWWCPLFNTMQSNGIATKEYIEASAFAPLQKYVVNSPWLLY